MTDQAVALWQGERYLARKAIFAFLGQRFHVYDAQGQLCFFVQQRAFKLKEALTVYADEGKQHPVLLIKARSIIDFSAIYDVSTPDGQRIGALQRQGVKSMVRDEWHILDTQDGVVGTIVEDSMAMALLRRFLSNLIPQGFTVSMHGREVASFQQHFNPFVAKYDLDFGQDAEGLLDRRLAIAAAIMLLAIEGRQQSYN